MYELAYPVVKQIAATMGASQNEYRAQVRVDRSNSRCNESDHLAVKQFGGASCLACQTGKMARQTGR